MATKSIDKKKTLEYAVAFYFYDSGCVNFMMGNIMYQHIKTIYDERADGRGQNTLETQKEFEERTELKLTADNYTEVETCYMNTDLDKDAFCKLWMKNPAALKEIEQKTVLVRELYEERKCLANFLIEQAEKWSASDLREKAIAMIGEKEYIRRKIAKGYNLWDADKKILDEILRK